MLAETSIESRIKWFSFLLPFLVIVLLTKIFTCFFLLFSLFILVCFSCHLNTTMHMKTNHSACNTKLHLFPIWWSHYLHYFSKLLYPKTRAGRTVAMKKTELTHHGRRFVLVVCESHHWQFYTELPVDYFCLHQNISLKWNNKHWK